MGFGCKLHKKECDACGDCGGGRVYICQACGEDIYEDQVCYRLLGVVLCQPCMKEHQLRAVRAEGEA